MLTKDYQEALTEVLAIVDTDQSFKAKIPQKLLNFFKENASQDYQIGFDINLKVQDMPLKKETKGLLSMLYRNYLCTTNEQKVEFDTLLVKNNKLYQDHLRELYNPDNVFKNSKANVEQNLVSNNTLEQNKEANLVTYKESFFTKIINKIKSFFNK